MHEKKEAQLIDFIQRAFKDLQSTIATLYTFVYKNIYLFYIVPRKVCDNTGAQVWFYIFLPLVYVCRLSQTSEKKCLLQLWAL